MQCVAELMVLDQFRSLLRRAREAIGPVDRTSQPNAREDRVSAPVKKTLLYEIFSPLLPAVIIHNQRK